MVAQIDEQQLAVITLAVHPAGKREVAPGIVEAKGAAGMGAIGVHRQGPTRSREGAEHGTDHPLLSRNPAGPGGYARRSST